jgi:hypothetical protein
MSVKVMGLVWDVKMPPNEKLVLLAYADHAAHDGTSIYPAVALVAEKTGYSEREVQRVTRTLQKKGLLVSDGTGPRGTNRWRYGGGGDNISPMTPEGVNTATSGGDDLSGLTANGVTSAAGQGDNLSRVTADGVTCATPGGDIDKREGVTPVSPEPSLTVSEPSTRGGLSQTEKDQANSKVTAMIEIAKKPTYINRDRIPEPYRMYADTYCALTGQEPTKRVLHDWLQTFSEWASESVRPEHVRQAHKESIGHFTVLRPGSLTNTAAALKAKGRVAPSTVRDALRETQRNIAAIDDAKRRAVPMPDEIRKRLEPYSKKNKKESSCTVLPATSSPS